MFMAFSVGLKHSFASQAAVFSVGNINLRSVQAKARQIIHIQCEALFFLKKKKKKKIFQNVFLVF